MIKDLGETDLEELRKFLIKDYYKGNETEIDKNRRMIITEIKNGYNKVHTIVFSINGSPPKGEAVLELTQDESENYYIGDLTIIKRRSKRRIKQLKILKRGKEITYEEYLYLKELIREGQEIIRTKSLRKLSRLDMWKIQISKEAETQYYKEIEEYEKRNREDGNTHRTNK